MKFNTVIFDLDGTLLNTLDDLCDSVNFTMRRFGRQERTLDEVRCFVGSGLRELMRKCLGKTSADEETDMFLAVFKEHYAENLNNKTAPYNGIPALLAKLKDNNIKIGIVSNKADAALKKLCALYFPEADTAAGEKEGVLRKPSPDGVFAALKDMSADIASAVYVGDSEVDIMTARNARLPVISVTWGFRDKEVLKKLNPDYMVDTAEELCFILTGEKLNKE